MRPLLIEPITVSVSKTQIADLQQRLQLTRWPESQTVTDWSQGVPLESMKELCEHWMNGYDWNSCEQWLNSLPQFEAKSKGMNIHFMHIRSPHEDAMPMLLVHGWPGSVLEFRKAIGPLTDPIAYGGRPEDAFHLVIPSLPGYGFSSQPMHPGWNLMKISEVFVELRESLDYRRWVAQGGDWGANLCAVLASKIAPASLAGLHLNTTFFEASREIRNGKRPSLQEEAALEKQRAFEANESGYYKLQATRPQTIGYALADSPVGQAAWIYEKIYAWSQHSGNLHKVFSMDEILDNIMLYWLTNTGASSARLYLEDDDGTDLPINVPVGVSIFPGDQYSAPREWV